VSLNKVQEKGRPKCILRWLSGIVVVALVLSTLPVQAHLLAQSDQTLQECTQVDEAALQDELNRVTQQIFSRALDEVDLATIVNQEWQRVDIDPLLDAEVDHAVERIKSEQALWDKFLSGWSADKAEELTRAVAGSAFESEAFAQKVEALSLAVADELAAQIAVLSAESVSAAFYCLQTFIADNYANVLVRQFEDQVRTATENIEFASSSELDTSILGVLDQHKTALGGIGVIVAAQIARRIVQNIGQQIARRVAGRIAGRVLGRIGTEIIPIVGWIVGTGLIAYDIYSSRDGALPQIQEQLKSAEVKAGIRDEIVAAMEPEFRREAPQIARDVANDLFSQWSAVKRNIRQVIDLTATDPAFAALMEQLETPDELAQLVNLVGVALPALGQEAFHQAVADGTLAQVLRQPPGTIQLVEATKSIDTALAWSALAGSMLDQVVEYELYKHKTPVELTRPLLEKLLALDNRATIEKLALMDLPDIESLLTVSTSNLNALAAALSAEDLKVVARFLPHLNQEQRNELISRLISSPSLAGLLESTAVQQQLVASSNIQASLAFLAGPRDLTALSGDVSALLTGQVGWGLFVYKYGTGQSALIGVGLVLLVLILLRLLYGLVAWLINPVTGLFRGSR
jgi:hypothetical protein